MIKDLLDTIAGWEKRFKQTPQPAAAAAAVQDLRKRSQAELGADIPDEYAELLQGQNGLDWNGMVFYATERSPIAGREGKKPRYIDGFVEANVLWREYEPRKDYLVFGDSGNALYTFNLPEKAFQERDRQSFDLIRVHPTLEAMLAEAMERHKPPNP
jgi:hypothetical protein